MKLLKRIYKGSYSNPDNALTGEELDENLTLIENEFENVDVKIESDKARISVIEEKNITGVQVVKNFANRSDGNTYLPAVGVAGISYKVANDIVDPAKNGYWSWSGTVYIKDANLVNGIVASGNVDAVSGGAVFNEVKSVKRLYDNFPLKRTANGTSIVDVLVLGEFFVNGYMNGTPDPLKTYSFAIIQRNYNGKWEIKMYSATGVPGTLLIVSLFSTLVNPEDGDNITTHDLTASNGSGLNGKIQVRWSKIPNGSNYTNMYDYVGYGIDSLFFTEKNILQREKVVLPSLTDYTKANQTTLLIDREKINPISYTHPRGMAEYAGDSTYSQPGVGLVQAPLNVKTIVRRIQFGIYASATFAGTVEVRKSTAFVTQPADLVETFTYLAGKFNSNSAVLSEVILTNDLILQENEYLYVIVTLTSGGYPTLKRWTTQSAVPLRNPILFRLSGVWYGGGTGYNSTPFLIYKDAFTFEDIQTNKVNIATLNNKVAVLEGAVTSVDIILPDKIQAVVGDKLQLFIRGMIRAINPYNYNIVITCTKGYHFPRYYELTPITSDIGNHNFTVQVKDGSGNILVTKTIILEIKSAGISPTTQTTVLSIGDSLTSAGTWVIEAERRLTKSGGLPLGKSFTNISFKGRKTDGLGVGYEGNGGWSWWEYATAGRSAYRFTVSGVVTAPSLGSTYTNNGITFTVDEVNITAGAGNIRTTYTSGTPNASGTLTKASGNGDLTIAYSASVFEAANPFWKNGALDLTSYVNTFMSGDLDVVYILLSWNGQSPNRTNFDTEKGYARTFFNHINATYPNAKIKLMGIQLPSLNGGMGMNYGADGVYSDVYGMVATALNMNKAYQDLANEVAYSGYVQFLNISAQFDSENNMPESDATVNTRNTKIEKRGTNGVHPATEGYYQIADAVYRNFVANFCQ